MKIIKLGYRVRDKVTGIEGIAVAKCIYLNGCIQYEVQPKANDKGEKVKELWADDKQLEFVDHGVLPEPKPEPKKTTPYKRTLSHSAGRGGGQRNHPDE